MKAYLCVDRQPIDDYVHMIIDTANDPPQYVGQYNENIDSVIADAECTHLIVDNVLSHVLDVQDAVNHLCSKIRRGGKVTIVDKDIFRLVQSIHNHELSFDGMRELLYNKTKSCTCLREVRQVLQDNNFTIEHMSLEDGNFTIEATR